MDYRQQTENTNLAAGKLIVKDLAIVVVDDTKFGRAVFKSVLTKVGYSDIRVADSAQHALEFMKQRRADVLVADWFMPGMSGLELTNRVRQIDEENHTYTSIILCTAQEGVAPLVMAFRRGVDDFIRKPFDHEELVARVYAAGNASNLQNMLLESTARLASSNRQLAEISMADPLTGLGNRIYYEKQLQALISEFTARGGGVCPALLKIDDFNSIRMEQSAADIDEILVSVGRRIVRVLRPTDVTCRLSTCEFGVVLHYPDVSNFRPTVFDRLQNDISGRPFNTERGELHITVSIGACFLEDQPENPTAGGLIGFARQNLEDAQKAGTNQLKY